MKIKLDKRHALLVLLVAALTLSAFVGMAAASAQTFWLWDDASSIVANDGYATHEIDALMRRFSIGDESKFVSLSDGDVAWWYARVPSEENLYYGELAFASTVYYKYAEEDPYANLIIDVYSIEPNGDINRHLASGDVFHGSYQKIVNTEGHVAYVDVHLPDDVSTIQTVLKGDRLAVRVQFVGDGTFELGYNGPTGHGEAPSLLKTPEGVPVPGYIDIKPESCPNAFNPKRKGVMSVAVLGTDWFDVTNVDPGTILLSRENFEGVAPLRWSYEDVATPFEGELCDCHEEGADGIIDQVLKFDNKELVEKLRLDEVTAGDTIPLTLTGELTDGTPFEGQDCIWIQNEVKDKKPKK